MDDNRCPMCGAQNPADAVHCGKCRVNLKLALQDRDEIERTRRDTIERRVQDRMEREQGAPLHDVPHGVSVQYGTDGLRASFRWFSWHRFLISIPGTVVALLVCGFVLWVFTGMLSAEEPSAPMTGLALLDLAFGLWLLGLGLWGLYTILGLVLNRTEVTVTGGELRIWHGPVAVRREWAIGCEDLGALTIKKVSKSGVPILLPYAPLTLEAPSFDLKAVIGVGESKSLLSCPDREVVEFLKSAIEQYTGSLQA